MRGSWRWHATAIGAAAVLALGACSGDDDVDASEGTTGTEAGEPAGGSTAEEVAAFCEQIEDVGVLVSIGEGFEEVDDSLIAAEELAPAEIAADVTTMADENRAQVAAGPPPEDTPPNPASDAYFTAAAAVGDYMAEHCDYQVIDVTATDHTYEGLPAEAARGKTLIRLTNDGTEYHELVLQRIRYVETRSVEEILALPDNGGDLLDYRGNAFAPPGHRNWAVVNLDINRYAAMCFIPTGSTTPETLRTGQTDEDSTRHHTQGMTAELKVP